MKANGDRVLTRNAGDPEQVAHAERTTQRREMTADEDLFFVMSSEPGRRFVMRFIRGMTEVETFQGESSHTTAYNCGVRRMAELLIAHLRRAAPDLYLTAQKEEILMEKRHGN